MSVVKSYIKFSIIMLLIFIYLVITTPFLFLINIWPYKTKRILNHIVGFFSKLVLAITGVKAEIDGIEHFSPKKNYFIICNHLSYLDILVMSTFFPSCYVTSVEMKETPVLGQIVTLAGCVFVERRNKKNIKNELKDIQSALKSGLNVVVFPEATSTDGATVFPFKRSMFQAAIDAEVDLLPLTLEYRSLNDKPLDIKSRDFLFWYDDTSFASHCLGLCKQKNAKVVLHVNEVLTKESLPTCAGELRDKSFEIIHEKYHSLVGTNLKVAESNLTS